MLSQFEMRGSGAAALRIAGYRSGRPRLGCTLFREDVLCFCYRCTRVTMTRDDDVLSRTSSNQSQDYDGPVGLPSSEYYTIRDTPYSGRGIFATKPIPAQTPLLTADDLTATIIYRDYRREVCLQCFAYDRGVAWPLRDPTTGLVFCSKRCRNAWFAKHDKICVRAHEAVESLLKSKLRKDAGDDVMMSTDGAEGGPPGAAEIERAWKIARNEGRRILNARTSLEPTKAELKALRGALSKPCDSQVLPYLLSAVEVAYGEPEAWETVLELKATPTPYRNTTVLESHVTGYLQLLAILPVQLLDFCTPAILQASVDRDAHNSFGLRSLDDDGDEMFGFGVWACASYFNHHCSPNVSKRREGRVWKFWAARDIQEGEELCITYLGSDTKGMPVLERRAKTMETWAFECGCQRCIDEIKPVRMNVDDVEQSSLPVENEVQ